MLVTDEKLDAAIEQFRESVSIFRQLSEKNAGDTRLHDVLGIAMQLEADALARRDKHDEAIITFSDAMNGMQRHLTLAGDRNKNMVTVADTTTSWADSLAALGRYEDSHRRLTELVAMSESSITEQLDAAQSAVRISQQGAIDKSLSTYEQGQLRDLLTDSAIDWIESALATGELDPDEFRDDEQLRPLEDSGRFQAALKSVSKQ